MIKAIILLSLLALIKPQILQNGIEEFFTPEQANALSGYLFTPPSNVPGTVYFSCDVLDTSVTNAACKIGIKKADGSGFTKSCGDRCSDYSTSSRLSDSQMSFNPYMISFFTVATGSKIRVKAEFVPLIELEFGQTHTILGRLEDISYYFVSPNFNVPGSMIFSVESKIQTYKSQLYFSNSLQFPDGGYGNKDCYSDNLADYSYSFNGGAFNTVQSVSILTSNEGQYYLTIKFIPLKVLESGVTYTMTPDKNLSYQYFQILPLFDKWLDIEIDITSESKDNLFTMAISKDQNNYFPNSGYNQQDYLYQKKNLIKTHLFNKISPASPFYLSILPFSNSTITLKFTQRTRADLTSNGGILSMYLFQNDWNYFYLSQPADSAGFANVQYKARDPLNSCLMAVGKSMDYPDTGYNNQDDYTNLAYSGSIQNFNMGAGLTYINFGIVCTFPGFVDIVGGYIANQIKN